VVRILHKEFPDRTEKLIWLSVTVMLQLRVTLRRELRLFCAGEIIKEMQEMVSAHARHLSQSSPTSMSIQPRINSSF
jgi:hypothetical protein